VADSRTPKFKTVQLPPSVVASLGAQLVSFGIAWLVLWGIIALATTNDAPGFRQYAAELREDRARVLGKPAATDAERLRATADALDLDAEIATIEAKARAADGRPPLAGRPPLSVVAA